MLWPEIVDQAKKTWLIIVDHRWLVDCRRLLLTAVDYYWPSLTIIPMLIVIAYSPCWFVVLHDDLCWLLLPWFTHIDSYWPLLMHAYSFNHPKDAPQVLLMLAYSCWLLLNVDRIDCCWTSLTSVDHFDSMLLLPLLVVVNSHSLATAVSCATACNLDHHLGDLKVGVSEWVGERASGWDGVGER